MGMMIGAVNGNRRVIELKDANGNVVGRITKTGGNNSKKPKKLMYNFKAVSTRILQVKSSGNARRTVILAQGKLAELRQKVKGRGDYDDNELAAAILHAEAMVRAAKKKQKNLLEEEKAEKGIKGEESDLLESHDENEVTENGTSLEDEMVMSGKNQQQVIEQLMRRMEQMMAEAMRAAEEAGGMDELSEELMSEEDMEPEDLELRKKKHRAEELKEIVEADMKYLKTLFDKLEREKQNNASGVKSMQNTLSQGGVSLEIGGAQVPVAGVEAAMPVEGGNLDMTV